MLRTHRPNEPPGKNKHDVSFRKWRQAKCDGRNTHSATRPSHLIYMWCIYLSNGTTRRRTWLQKSSVKERCIPVCAFQGTLWSSSRFQRFQTKSKHSFSIAHKRVDTSALNRQMVARRTGGERLRKVENDEYTWLFWAILRERIVHPWWMSRNRSAVPASLPLLCLRVVVFWSTCTRRNQTCVISVRRLESG